MVGLNGLTQAQVQLLLRKNDLTAAIMRNPEGLAGLTHGQLVQLALLDSQDTVLKCAAIQDQVGTLSMFGMECI